MKSIFSLLALTLAATSGVMGSGQRQYYFNRLAQIGFEVNNLEHSGDGSERHNPLPDSHPDPENLHHAIKEHTWFIFNALTGCDENSWSNSPLGDMYVASQTILAKEDANLVLIGTVTAELVGDVYSNLPGIELGIDHIAPDIMGGEPNNGGVTINRVFTNFILNGI